MNRCLLLFVLLAVALLPAACARTPSPGSASQADASARPEASAGPEAWPDGAAAYHMTDGFAAGGRVWLDASFTSIPCLTSACTVGTQACCYTALVSYAGAVHVTASCITSGAACQGSPSDAGVIATEQVSCAGALDCAAGEKCCASVPTLGALHGAAACTGTCPTGDLQLCLTAAECPAAAPCCSHTWLGGAVLVTACEPMATATGECAP